ncbi:P-type conjugative transfer protein VirB9 [Rickettsia endosymbiont of Cardiosporidium cionae]|uniref:P-type conjugative transfer protein VirB9 n=1 Tax=Rickettsia endosymbiont of Cardiosporidium cionae TaxID=2777155 RepID=UPI00389B02F1
MYNIILFLIFCFSVVNTAAVQESRPTTNDNRIRVLVYHPNDVFKFVGYYNYQANIELSKEESIVNISMGDTTAWQIVPSGNLIFIKPIERDATTNMTLITNKRTYYFELYAEDAIGIRDPNMVFSVKFLYPGTENDNIQNFHHHENIIKKSDNPENLNFLYFISGDREIAPIKIFDDGEFTYLQFRKLNNNIPAIFSVDENLRESMVNFKTDPENDCLIIIEQIYKKISLRSGDKILCIFNESDKYLMQN